MFAQYSVIKIQYCFNYQAYSIPSSPPPNTGSRSSVIDLEQDPDEKLSKTNLYIRGLSPGTTDEDLNNLCSR